MTQPIYKTSTPQAFAQFFSEEPSEKILAVQETFEKCHGACNNIQVVFFKEVPGKCAEQLKDDTKYSKVVKYQFSDCAITREFTQRELHVTVVV